MWKPLHSFLLSSMKCIGYKHSLNLRRDYCYSVTQLCPTLCDPMDCSMPPFLILYHHTELAQTHVSWVGDPIQPSHPLLSPSLPAFNLSQQQGFFFQWVSSSHQVAEVLELQYQSFEIICRIYFLWHWLVWFSSSPRDSQEFSPTPHFKSINSSVLSFLYSPTLTSPRDHWKNQALTRRTFVGKVMSLLFHMLSRLVITFLPRSKCLLISWLQSPSAVKLA